MRAPFQEPVPEVSSSAAPPVSPDSPAGTVALDVTDLAVVAPVATVAVLVGLALRPLVRGVLRWAYPRAASSTGRSFELRDVAAIALVFLGLQLVASAAVALFDLDPDGLLVALNLTVALQGATAAAVLALARLRPHGFAALGLRPRENGWAGAYGLAAYFGALPFLFALMALTPFLLERVAGLAHDPQEVARMIASAEGTLRLVVPLYAAVLIPLLEELLFRGFLQNALEPRVGPAAAIGLTSVAFAALHGTSAFVPIFGLSVVLGLVMRHTRRLSACWLVHGLHNGLTTLALFVAPDTLLPS